METWIKKAKKKNLYNSKYSMNALKQKFGVNAVCKIVNHNLDKIWATGDLCEIKFQVEYSILSKKKKTKCQRFRLIYIYQKKDNHAPTFLLSLVLNLARPCLHPTTKSSNGHCSIHWWFALPQGPAESFAPVPYDPPMCRRIPQTRHPTPWLSDHWIH